MRFCMFEKALTTLADVGHLAPEIVVDRSLNLNWTKRYYKASSSQGLCAE